MRQTQGKKKIPGKDVKRPCVVGVSPPCRKEDVCGWVKEAEFQSLADEQARSRGILASHYPSD